MDINTAKSIVLGTLFLVTFISCLIPLKLINTIRHASDPTSRLRYEQILSLLNCFAGGVFLGTCLLDLLPEVQENINIAIVKLHINSTFPIPEFLVVLGLFIVLIIEQISLDCKQSHDRSHNEREPLLSRTQQGSPTLSSSSLNTTSYGSESVNSGRSESLHHAHSHHSIPVNSSIRSLLLLAALSLHSVFEGLAIGLQDNVNEVLQIFAAVILHKCVIAFGLSLNLVQSNLNTRTIIKLTFIFCIAAPLGLGLGMGVMEISNSLEAIILSGVLQGLACGTFLYVTFFEVLPHELNSNALRTPKMIFIILGFAASCAIVFLDPNTDQPKCP